MPDRPRYHINVFWSHRAGCWIADVPDLASCSAHGDSPLNAVIEVEAATESWLKSALSGNLAIPLPKYDWKTEPLI